MPTSFTDSPRLRVGLLVLLGVLVVALVTAAGLATRSDDPGGAPSPAAAPAGRPTALPPRISPVGASGPAESDRPNIVVVMADDMRTDELRFMPNVRRLVADRGLTFRNSFSPYPLCCPARASFLTGQYAHNHHVWSHVRPWGYQAFDDRRTLATSLNDSGYNTVFIGKYLNGYGRDDSLVTGKGSFRYVPPGWTDWYGAVSRPPHSGYPSGGTYNYWNTIYNINGKIDAGHKGQYQTRTIGRFARKLVRKYHRSPKPFFMWVNPVAPHFGAPRENDDPAKNLRIKTPARPESVRGRFDAQIPRAAGLPLTGGPSEADMSDKPLAMRDLAELDAADRDAVRALTRQRAEAISVLDHQVGRLVGTLKATGEYDDTVIMFTSDNGYFLGEHRMRQGKIKPHEPSLRVPFVVAGKGVPRGTRFDPITTMGITATVVDIAGSKAPFAPDARSMVPTFARDRGWSVPVLTEGVETSRPFKEAAHDPAPGFDDPRTTIGIRTSRYSYFRYNTGEGELYDLDKDPNQMRSVFGEPRYAAVQAELQKLWLSHRTCAGASCRTGITSGLRRGPAQERVSTDRQSRGVQKRYGYWR
jgi:N-acetylglucosamine-6-sulfatase